MSGKEVMQSFAAVWMRYSEDPSRWGKTTSLMVAVALNPACARLGAEEASELCWLSWAATAVAPWLSLVRLKRCSWAELSLCTACTIFRDVGCLRKTISGTIPPNVCAQKTETEVQVRRHVALKAGVLGHWPSTELIYI